MLTGFLAALARALGDFLRGWLGDRRASLRAQELGAAKAAKETLETIAETADARANLPPVPDDAAALARVLRDAAGERGGAAAQPK